jgi:hypothetical protein
MHTNSARKTAHLLGLCPSGTGPPHHWNPAICLETARKHAETCAVYGLADKSGCRMGTLTEDPIHISRCSTQPNTKERIPSAAFHKLSRFMTMLTIPSRKAASRSEAATPRTQMLLMSPSIIQLKVQTGGYEGPSRWPASHW